MSPTPSHTPDSAADLDQVIDEATTRIHTQTLSDRGVQKLRILSQSRFLHMIEDLVERTLEQKVSAAQRALLAEGLGGSEPAERGELLPANLGADRSGSPTNQAHRALVLPPPGHRSALGRAPSRVPLRSALESIRREIESHYEAAWTRLRSEQTEQLLALESRLAGLKGSLGEIVRSIESLETREGESQEEMSSTARTSSPQAAQARRRRIERAAVCDTPR